VSKGAHRFTRKDKIEQDKTVHHKEKFVTEEPKQTAAQKLVAQTKNQALQLKYQNEGRKVIWAIGAAGSGKSFLAAHHAAEQLRKKQIERIVLVRPNVSTGKSLGMLPGDLNMKLSVFFTQTLAHLSTFMGKGFCHYALEKGTIYMQSLEHMRGLSIDNAVVIAEEVQNMTSDEFEMLLSRLGDNCQLILTGDQKQTDLKADSGLLHTVNLINKTVEDRPAYMTEEDLNELEFNTGVVNYTMHDVVRSGLCRAFVKMYHHN
jgi:phosphate starvation-inducible protein PhoH and related proteins